MIKKLQKRTKQILKAERYNNGNKKFTKGFNYRFEWQIKELYT